jgi:hypothetical protein
MFWQRSGEEQPENATVFGGIPQRTVRFQYTRRLTGYGAEGGGVGAGAAHQRKSQGKRWLRQFFLRGAEFCRGLARVMHFFFNEWFVCESKPR